MLCAPLTPLQDPRNVLEHETGLDPRFSRKGFYGHGLYLAKKSNYSNKGYAFKKKEGGRDLRQLLFVRAAVGKPKKYGTAIDRGITVDKMADPENPGCPYDSVLGGPHTPSRAGDGPCSSTMVVLYDLSQAYPEYLVTYELV